MSTSRLSQFRAQLGEALPPSAIQTAVSQGGPDSASRLSVMSAVPELALKGQGRDLRFQICKGRRKASLGVPKSQLAHAWGV